MTRPRDNYTQDPAFYAMVKSWPVDRRGNLEAAFVAWQGQGEAGKLRIAASVQMALARAGPHTLYLPGLSTIILNAAAVPYEPPTPVVTKAKEIPYKCQECGEIVYDYLAYSAHRETHPSVPIPAALLEKIKKIGRV